MFSKMSVFIFGDRRGLRVLDRRTAPVPRISELMLRRYSPGEYSLTAMSRAYTPLSRGRVDSLKLLHRIVQMPTVDGMGKMPIRILGQRPFHAHLPGRSSVPILRSFSILPPADRILQYFIVWLASGSLACPSIIAFFY